MSSTDRAQGTADTQVGDAATLLDARTDDRTNTGATLPGRTTSGRTTSGRTTTVLPRVEVTDGELRLVHEPRDRYETERLLGEGGMGIVALARDLDIDRKVALKRIRREAGQRGLARFAEEVRIIGNLEHPNIVPVHDVGVDENGDYFFVMKYVEGQTLEEIIELLAKGDPETHRRFTFEERARVFAGLLRALHYAHDRGVVHRDVKPANIMVGPYGEVVLMDWGVAKPIDRGELVPPEDTDAETDQADAPRRRLVQTQAHGLIGTPAYMAPEQARGEPTIDPRCDLYAACVVLHELLTLRHYLSEEQTVPGILLGVMERQLPPAYRTDLYAHPQQSSPPPAELVHFVIKGTQKDRAARWQSALEMETALTRALEGKLEVQCPVTLTKRALRETTFFVDRHPGFTSAMVGLSGLGLLAGLGALLFVALT